MSKIKMAMAGAAVSLAAATTAAEAGCVFNANGKVVGGFGGDTVREFDRAGQETANKTNNGFSVGYSNSRGERAFFDDDNKAASKANFNAAFPDGIKQAWYACIKKEWIPGKGPASVFGAKTQPEVRVQIPDEMIKRAPAQRSRQETPDGSCIRVSCNYILRKHGL